MKKPIDMVDDGGDGDCLTGVVDGDISGEMVAGDVSNCDVDSSSKSVVGGGILGEIGRYGGSGSNFVSCNFYIGCPPSVC